MATNLTKRSGVTFSIQEKLQAIQRFRCGETKASISRDIGIAESTFRGWCKNEEKMKSDLIQLEQGPSKNLGSAGQSSMLESKSSSCTSLNHGEQATPSPESEREKNLAELRRLGAELGLHGPEENPSVEERAAMLQTIQNFYTLMNYNMTVQQYLQRISLERDLMAFGAYPNFGQTLADYQEYCQLQKEVGTSRQKVEQWLFNQRIDGAGNNEEEVCRCDM